MLSKKLELSRFQSFELEFADDMSYEELVSAFLSERHAPHRGRETNADAIVHNLITNRIVAPGALS